MHLETIGSFDWENEPDFNFCEDSIVIKPSKKTDFWQDKRHNISAKPGHFFCSQKINDFAIISKWKIPEQIPQMAQFGIMSKIDDENWCKISLTKDKSDKLFLFISVTNNGISDFCRFSFTGQAAFVYYKIQSIEGIFSVSYSLDGANFNLLRVFQFIKESKIHKIGAYSCNPTEEDFKAVLEEISIS